MDKFTQTNLGPSLFIAGGTANISLKINALRNADFDQMSESQKATFIADATASMGLSASFMGMSAAKLGMVSV